MLLNIHFWSLRWHVQDDAFDLVFYHGLRDPLRKEKGRFEIDVEYSEKEDSLQWLIFGLIILCMHTCQKSQSSHPSVLQECWYQHYWSGYLPEVVVVFSRVDLPNFQHRMKQFRWAMKPKSCKLLLWGHYRTPDIIHTVPLLSSFPDGWLCGWSRSRGRHVSPILGPVLCRCLRKKRYGLYLPPKGRTWASSKTSD